MFEAGGFTFLIDKELQGQTGNVKIDMTYYGFVVESEKPVGGGGGCSSGSCGTGSAGGGCSTSGCSC